MLQVLLLLFKEVKDWHVVTQKLVFFLAAQTSCSLLAVTTLSLLVPAAFSASTPEEDTVESILQLSHGVSIVLLIVYILYLLFQVTHIDNIYVYIYMFGVY